MTKPQEYNAQQVIRHETPYQVDERFAKGPQAGTGVLSAGRVVWTEGAEAASGEEASVSAFAEGIGVISVHAGNLRN